MEKTSAKYVDDLIDDDEIPELTEEDFKKFIPFSELPLAMQESLLSLNRESPEAKQAVALSPEIVAAFRERGADWERQMENALRDWLREHAA